MSSSTNYGRQSTGWAPRWMHLGAGGLLLCAALLKGIQLVNDPTAESLFPTRPATALAVLMEAMLGVWLLIGVLPNAARVVAAGSFLVFFAVSVYSIANGRRSCGCFGAVEVTPWLTAGLDLVMAVGLLWVRPPAGPVVPPRWAWAAGALAVAGAVSAWPVLTSGHAVDRLEAIPPTVRLGVVGRGRSASAEVTLANHLGETVEVSAYDASCPCLSVRFDAPAVEPGVTVHGVVTLDMAHEPAFVGLLQITVKGYSPARRVVYQFAVTADVRE